MIVWELISAILLFAAVPMGIGSIYERGNIFRTGRKLNIYIFRYLLGTVTMWALFQLLAVPMILLKRRFSLLVFLWMGALLLTAAVGTAVRKRRHEQGSGEICQEIPAASEGDEKGARFFFWLIILGIAVLYAFEAGNYLFLQHIDDDDARFVATAVEAVQHDSMLLENPATGHPLPVPIGEVTKDITSPWMLYIAGISLIMRIHPAIMAHTVYPVVLLLVSFLCYWSMGAVLFREDKEKTALFLFLAMWIQLFFSETKHTQAVFTLTRIWQGKAVVASVIIPLLFTYMLYLFREESSGGDTEKRAGDIFWGLLMTVTASCLMSGMGTIIAAVMTGCIFAWQFLLCPRRWVIMRLLLLEILPVLYAAAFIVLKSEKLIPLLGSIPMQR